jgi:hypothetical protein
MAACRCAAECGGLCWLQHAVRLCSCAALKPPLGRPLPAPSAAVRQAEGSGSGGISEGEGSLLAVAPSLPTFGVQARPHSVPHAHALHAPLLLR